MNKFKNISILFFLSFSFILDIRAQNNQSSKGIEIGQLVPDALITNIHNYKTNHTKLSDFRGKLLILDFWATWCSPCIAMIPKMDSLQKQFEGKVQFLTVTYQKEKEVKLFLEKLQQQRKIEYNLPEVMDDKVLHGLFPHRQLPHYVWIDEKGIVKAITGFEEITSDNIRKGLTRQSLNFEEKKDIVPVPYDKTKPLLPQIEGVNSSNLIYQSLLTGFTEGLQAGWDFTTPDTITKRKIVLRNCPLFWFYRIAFGGDSVFFPVNQVIMEVNNPSLINSTAKGKEYVDWMKKGNVFCYELIVPARLNSLMFKIMQEDLKRVFPQYTAAIEMYRTKCLALIRTSGIDKLSAQNPGGDTEEQIDALGLKLRNSFLTSYVSSLKNAYLQKYSIPLINETDYTGRIDLDINANLGNVEAMNKELEKYDLKWVEKETEISMLVIRDKSKQIILP